MKTKNLKRLSFLGMLALIFLFSGHGIANPNGKKEKKTINVYKKAYITHPLFVFAMHNGEQYAFINSNKHKLNSSTKESDSATTIMENKNTVTEEKTSNSKCFEIMAKKITQEKYEEVELTFEDWMISNFNSTPPVEKELVFELWMTNENHWKLKE